MADAKATQMRRRRASIQDTISGILWPLGSFVLLMVLWEVAVNVLQIREYILPAPSKFFVRLFESRSLIWDQSLVTGGEVLLGFLSAAVFSIPLALLIVSVPALERGLYPLIVFFQLVPKIAIAPLFIVWFGFTLFPKVLLTFLLCFFPILVDSMTGFKAIDPRLLYITRSMGASRWQTFRYIRLPAAMPFIFSGLKVSIVLAPTAAIVAEFVGANQGLGYLLLRGTSYLDTSLIFAALIALAVMGLVFDYVMEGGEQIVMPWKTKKER